VQASINKDESCASLSFSANGFLVTVVFFEEWQHAIITENSNNI
jgi:hypothetical protein